MIGSDKFHFENVSLFSILTSKMVKGDSSVVKTQNLLSYDTWNFINFQHFSLAKWKNMFLVLEKTKKGMKSRTS